MPEKLNGIIQRKRINEILDSPKDERFIYICAPEGYGKTTAVRGWLNVTEGNKALISLDEYSDSIEAICGHICRALTTCLPENKLLYETVGKPSFGLATEAFAAHAVSAAGASESGVIVIDDLHFINEEKHLKLISSLMKKLPESFKVIMTSRRKPPKGIFELYGKNDGASITAEKLRFSPEEIIRLYEGRGRTLTYEQAEEAFSLTGGRAISVKALLLSGESPSDLPAGCLDELDSFIEERLWSRWSEDIREFMVSSSVVDEMTGELCEAITGRADSERILESLLEEGMFIDRTAEGRYRYHRLFGSFLRGKPGERGKGYTDRLLRREGEGCIKDGDLEKAMDCFIRLESREGVAECAELLVTEGFGYLSAYKYIKTANPSLLHGAAEIYPHIYTILSLGAFAEGRVEDMAKYAEQYYDSQNKHGTYDSAAVTKGAAVHLVDFRKGLLELARGIRRGDIELGGGDLAAARTDVREISRGMPLLHRGIRDFSECAYGNIEENIELMKKSFGELFGEQAGMLADCVLAGMFYERGMLGKAHKYAESAVAGIKPDFSAEGKLWAMSVLVSILDGLEQGDKADGLLTDMERVIRSDNTYHLAYNLSVLRARREIARGDTKTAKAWLSRHKTPAEPGSAGLWELYGQMTAARAYIKAGSYDLAVALLLGVLETAEAYNRPLDIIEANTLLAAAYWRMKRGYQQEAVKHMEAAVTEAHNYGFVQVFVNERAELKGLLGRLTRVVEQVEHGSLIPVNFVRYIEERIAERTDTHIDKAVKFTSKQKAVVCLLCEGKSYSEIARALGVSNATVRSRMTGVYSKLSLSSKAETVKAVKRLGILDVR